MHDMIFVKTNMNKDNNLSYSKLHVIKFIYYLTNQFVVANNTQPFVTCLFHYQHNFDEQSTMRDIYCRYIRQQNGKNDLIYGTLINKQTIIVDFDLSIFLTFLL